jgi:hypothetical protein
MCIRDRLYTEQVVVDGKLQKDQQTIAYGPPEFQQEVKQRLEQGQRLWQ